MLQNLARNLEAGERNIDWETFQHITARKWSRPFLLRSLLRGVLCTEKYQFLV